MRMVISRKAVVCLIGGAAALVLLAVLYLFYWSYQSNALWRIVRHCGVDSDHNPCAVYRAKDGYAILKAREGRGQYLLIPTQPLRGIESAYLLRSDSPPYLAQAWGYRQLVAQAYGWPIADARLSLAINSRRARSQEQLHIHIDCVRKDVWQQVTHLPQEQPAGELRLSRHMYHWWRIPTLSSPLWRIGFILPQGADETERGRYGLVVIAVQGGFILLRSRAAGMMWGYAEELQDHQCRP